MTTVHYFALNFVSALGLPKFLLRYVVSEYVRKFEKKHASCPPILKEYIFQLLFKQHCCKLMDNN
jgi:hypothetical protein